MVLYHSDLRPSQYSAQLIVVPPLWTFPHGKRYLGKNIQLSRSKNAIYGWINWPVKINFSERSSLGNTVQFIYLCKEHVWALRSTQEGPLGQAGWVTLTSNPSCWEPGRAMMSSWLCHISRDHVWPQGILAGCWLTERPGRKLEMGIGEANEPEKGGGGDRHQKMEWWWTTTESRGNMVHLSVCRLSGSQLKQMLHEDWVTRMLQINK